MNDAILDLVGDYGLWLVGITTFFSCLAVPVPSSLMMIAGGAFAASSDLSLGWTVAAALTGAIAGDQVGMAIGRSGQSLLQRWSAREGHRAALLKRARAFMDKWGSLSVFLSRWLFSPLGPYVNFIAGANGIKWVSFTLAAAAGEVVWVTTYTGLGYVFSNNIDLVVDMASNISGFLVAGLVAAVLGRLLFRASR